MELVGVSGMAETAIASAFDADDTAARASAAAHRAATTTTPAATATTEAEASLSSRGRRAVAPAMSYLGKFFAGMADTHHPDTNPGGYVLMAVAENRVGFEGALAKLATCRDIDASTGAYDDFLGRSALRKQYAAFVNRTLMRRPGGSAPVAAVAPSQLAVASGVGALLNHLAFTLLEAGDAVLLPTPTYPALYNDMCTLARAVIVDVPTTADGYHLTEAALETGVAAARAAGSPPRMLLLLNPQNPTGVVYSAAELHTARRVAARHGMHLVVDEIYAHSVHTPDAAVPFRSAAEVFATDGGAGETVPMAAAGGEAPRAAGEGAWLGNHVHVLWGFSKDWCMSGLRVGILYTHNPALRAAMSNVGYFAGVSNDTQDALAAMLSDTAWCDAFLGRARGMLADSYADTTAALAAAHIPFTPAAAGMFVWVDLSAMLPRPGDWSSERALVDRLWTDHRILLTPGEACHAAHPGAARLCFAWAPLASVRVGVARLVAAYTAAVAARPTA